MHRPSRTAAAGAGADTVALAAGSTYSITQVDNTFFGFTGLPVASSQISLNGNGATISRGASAPRLRLLAVSPGGYLTIVKTTLTGGLAAGGNGATTPAPTTVAVAVAARASAARSSTAAPWRSTPAR